MLLRVQPLFMMRVRWIAWLSCLPLLAACATVTFKPGASGEAMKSDDRACRAANPDEAGYTACMRERGWSVLATEGLAPNDRAPGKMSPTPQATPAAAAPASPAAPRKSPRAGTNPPAAALDAAPARAPEPAAVAPPNNLQRVEVNGWWKLGASSADLNRDIDICVGKLGEVNRPNATATVITVRLRDCLRAAGWYGLGESQTH